jgi:hypothetical protein
MSVVGVVGSGAASRTKLSQIISDLGQSTNLAWLYDFGDTATLANNTAQTVTDLSGNAWNSYRGGDSGVGGNDPAINGTPGNLSENEYLSFDGGDRLETINAIALGQEVWASNAQFSIAALIYKKSTLNAQYIAVGGGLGFQLVGNTGIALFTAVEDTNWIMNASVPLTNDAWNFVLASAKVGGGSNTSFISVNGVSQAFTLTAAFPTADNGTSKWRIGADFIGTNTLISGSRLAGIMAWKRAVSLAETDSLRQRIKAFRSPSLV